MPTYMDALTKEQLEYMNGAIDSFLDHYKTFGIPRGDQQKTVLFFPGGLGSELSRAYGVFDPNGNPNYTYRQFWYDVVLIRGLERAALWLQMRRQDDVDYDSGNRFILAKGEMDNCVLPPYDGFVDWCGINGLDLLMCAWDNRRDCEWLVSFFMNDFPAYVRERAKTVHNIDTDTNDPLANVYLVGHSQGGMLVKLIVNKHQHEFCGNVRLAVTVATPFYGTVSQSHRMFEGEPAVGGLYSKTEIAKAIATMPGGYVLFFLNSQTYDNHKPDFECDVYPLLGYPSVDSVDGSRVDPYVHARRGYNEYRYHEFGWDLGPYINGGLRQYRLIAQDLHHSIKGRFHNIRGVQVHGGADHLGTPGSLTWSWIRDTFNPDRDPSPIVDGPKVPGDGTVPAWSARLLPAQEGHVHTVWGDKRYFEHMFLMESDGVLAKLWELLQTGQQRRESEVIMARREIKPASVDELARVSRKLTQIAEGSKSRKKVAVKINAYIEKIKPRKQKALVKRWFIEMAKGPSSALAKKMDPPNKKDAPKKKAMDSPAKKGAGQKAR